MTEENYWKNKLLAYLHDPPHKPLDIVNHEEEAKSIIRSADFVDEETAKLCDKSADHLSSSIDRFPFPKKWCTAKFTGMITGKDERESTFVHPFSGQKYEIPDLKSLELYSSVLHNAFGGFNTDDWKNKFFLYWRRWLDNSVEQDLTYASDLAVFPADTRIPDHTVWTHMAITSALEGCRNPNTKKIEPAFLIFQAGPVQDFIAQARSTIDLWSGSYMLSWLIGNAIKAITDECGPDSIIFPALRGLGIFDVLNKEVYDNISYSDGKGSFNTLWDRIFKDEDQFRKAEVLLTPAMPNRFFALVPAYLAETLAVKAEKAFRKELANISHHCYQRFAEYAETLGVSPSDEWQIRWNKQIELFPEISWQTMPVEEDIDLIIQKAEKLPAMHSDDSANSSLNNVKALLTLAQQTIPKEHRDKRYYADPNKTKLKNWGLTWALQFAMCEYALAARRNTRNFDAYITDENQHGSLKDSLSGKEEVIGGEDFWKKAKADNSIFKSNEGSYGAVTLIKRLWCKDLPISKCYLFEQLGIAENVFQNVISAESVEKIAKNNIKTQKEVQDGQKESSNPYVAVLAMDGDSMGKWMSGENAPKFVNQLSGKAKKYISDLLGEEESKELVRSLTPSYHLQFSEALANFANHLCSRIVKHFDGQLIYAGGDDVLAMVPASQAIKCAQVLRAAFRGDKEYFEKQESSDAMELAIMQNGFVRADAGYPLIVPGPSADVSCGIAIAHFKYPLQRMIKEARIAESRAKKEYNRSAFAIALLKRGGEIIHWGSKWNSAALDLFATYVELRQNDDVSGRFPYVLAELLHPYKLEKMQFDEKFDVHKIIFAELQKVLEQQVSKGKSRLILKELSKQYLENLAEGYGEDDKKRCFWEDFAKLFLTAAFIERDRGE